MIRVSIRGLPEAQRAVDGLTKGMRAKLQKTTKVGADKFKSPAKAEARHLSKRLGRSVRVRKARRDLPATVLSFNPKVAWFRHFVIQGTNAHGPRRARMLRWEGKGGVIFARRVRGVPPHPILEHVVSAHLREAQNAMADQLLKE